MSANPSSVVLARLPHSGLGNKLFVWARALVFARINGLPLVVHGWCTPSWRHFLRSGDLRFYWNYFRPWQEASRSAILELTKAGAVEHEPELAKISPGQDPRLYKFTEMTSWRSPFQGLTAHRELIRDELFSHLTEARKREIAAMPDPTICLQVRMTDFRELKPEEKFAHVGNVRTPLQYFQDMIVSLRAAAGSKLPVTLVSDGRAAELAPLLELGDVRWQSGHTGLADLLLMARAKVLVYSGGSTFGQWGGFLGQPVFLHHPDHMHGLCRSELNSAFEGAVWPSDCHSWPAKLQESLRHVASAWRSQP